MLPLNSQKALFSGEEANVIRFALSIFLQTDFAGLTSKKEEEKAFIPFTDIRQTVSKTAFR